MESYVYAGAKSMTPAIIQADKYHFLSSVKEMLPLLDKLP